jgi:hypothetical protein
MPFRIAFALLAATAWLDWLKQPAAQAIIRCYGYELPGEGK